MTFRASALLFVVFFSFTLQASPDQPGDCNFLCERVPDQDEVYHRIETPTPTRAKRSFYASTLTVNVWNIYKSRKKAWSREFNQLASASDILILQEMSLNNLTLDQVNKHSKFVWDHASNFFQKDNVRTGVGTGSVAKPVFTKGLLTPLLEPFVKSPKSSLITKYHWSHLAAKETLMIINIHGMNRRRWQGLKTQVEQVLPYIRSHKGPIIYAGDFNTHYASRLEKLDHLLAPVGLKRVIWPRDTRELVLDHVYVKDLSVKNPRLIEQPEGSDHPILKVEISNDF